MEIESVLRDEITYDFEKLKEMDVGSDEYRSTIDSITKLMDRAIEIEKINVGVEEKAQTRETEQKTRELEEGFKRQQMEEDRKNRLIMNCIAVAGIVIPSAITIWGTLKSFEFEKEGTITTIMGRGFINKLLPKK